jgi:PAS domain-containing protein
MAIKPAFTGHGISSPQGLGPQHDLAGSQHDPLRDYERVFQAVSVPLIVVDHSSLHVVAVNRAAVQALGQQESTILASSLADLVLPSEHDLVAEMDDPAGIPGLLEAHSRWTLVPRAGPWLRMKVTGEPVLFANRPCAILVPL